jgi:hypothetical protein
MRRQLKLGEEPPSAKQRRKYAGGSALAISSN